MRQYQNQVDYKLTRYNGETNNADDPSTSVFVCLKHYF